MSKRTVINLKSLLVQKEARDGRDYTYEDVANATGLSMSTVYSLANNRNGRVDIKLIDSLLDWLNAEWSDLMIRIEIDEPENQDSPESKTPLAAAS